MLLDETLLAGLGKGAVLTPVDLDNRGRILGYSTAADGSARPRAIVVDTRGGGAVVGAAAPGAPAP